MKRWAVLFAAGAAALVVLHAPWAGDAPRASLDQSQAREDERSAERPNAGTPPDAVLVSHELVTAAVVHEPVRVNGRTPRGRTAPASRVSDAAPRERPGGMSRAVRVLVGDGRHRPEPFPRPKP